MTIHIGAEPGQVAETVLMPGDPLRARYIAEHFLEEVICFNEVRAMYGYTGTYHGKRVSTMGSGMGMPSISIYAHELINGYGVKNLIRVGSCGAMQPELKLRDVILVKAACTDSQVNRLRFQGMDFAPAASFDLLHRAYETAVAKNIPVTVGTIVSSDTFYWDDNGVWDRWASYGILAAEMETAALYTLAAKFKVNALTLLTVADHIYTGAETTAAERERSFAEMMEIALAIA